MTVFYKVIYPYDTDREDELSIRAGEIVRIHSKDTADWWSAERLADHHNGLVPSNFLEALSEGILLATVIEDYAADGSDELTLHKNNTIVVTDQDIADGWWLGESDGKSGIFPANHVEIVADNIHSADNDSKAKKDKFKLAAFGVKQGGIGSILAGGFSSLKRSSTNRTSVNERPPSVNTPSDPPVNAPSISSARSDTTMKSTKQSTLKAMAIYSYTPENEDELQLMGGEYVTIVDQTEDNGWWKGTNESGKTGVFPSNYVQVLEEEKPPQRPPRRRPPTVKSDSLPPTNEKEGQSAPPPIPVSTRPTSLLSQRENQSSTLSNSHARPFTTPPRPSVPPPPLPVNTPTIPSNSRPFTTPPRPSVPPPPLPVNTPTIPSHSRPSTTPPRPSVPLPPRPVNTITIPPRRSNSITSPDAIKHRRTPSVPVLSPDLPPISPGFDRPTRSMTRPVSPKIPMLTKQKTKKL
ncbi:SH3 domain-containing protein [Pilobolus umbonatus]|nr:SH3 domain-containing protein [Pilobolus umbonatus]